MNVRDAFYEVLRAPGITIFGGPALAKGIQGVDREQPWNQRSRIPGLDKPDLGLCRHNACRFKDNRVAGYAPAY